MIIANRFNLGGIQINILDILSKLNAGKKLEPILVLRKADGEFMDRVSKRIKVIDLNLGESIGSGAIMILKLMRVIGIYQPAKILTFGDHVSLLTIFARYFSLHSGIHQIITEGIHLSSYLKKQPYGILRKILIKKFYPLVDKIVVLSEAQKTDLVENFNLSEENIEVINNWVSPIHFKIKLTPETMIPKDYDIVFVGRLEKQKNLPKFIEIISRLSKIFPDLKVKIVGVGSQFYFLKQAVKEMRLSKIIFFTGFSANPINHYRSAKTFLLTSLFEGQPHTVLEAMWVGLPVVAVRSPGLEEIISNGKTGYVVINIEEAVAALAQLLKNDSLRIKLGQQAKVVAHEKYGTQNLNKILKVINKPC